MLAPPIAICNRVRLADYQICALQWRCNLAAHPAQPPEVRMPRLLAGLALLATCLATAAFQQPLAAPAHVGAALRRPSLLATPNGVGAGLPRPSAQSTRAHQSPTASATGPTASLAEIRAFFGEYLRLHEQKDMAAWPKLFLDGATIVRTGSDARVIRYTPADLAARIATEAAKLDSQHETFEDIRIEADGAAAMYSTHWKLFHNGALVSEGRAWFSLVRDAGQWRIASLVWYNH